MTKTPVNFRIDSELLALAKATADREGITLITLLERSLRLELGVPENKATGKKIDVEALVESVVKAVSKDIESVRMNIADVKLNVEAVVNTIAESVNTIQGQVTDLSHKLDNVNTVVDTIVNTNSVNTSVKSDVDTDEQIDGSTAAPAENSQDWVNLTTIATALQIKPKSITDAVRKRGRDLGNDTIEFDMSGKTIRKQGKGINALYHILIP
jgi:hypothetical protein